MPYRIGQVARLVNMTVEGLRFYERKGLVSPASRTASGYRVYTDEQVASLRFVRAAQEMGFSLAEIRELLRLRAGGDRNCHAMREHLRGKLETVRRRMALLRQFEGDLADAIRRCDARIDSGREGCCPVLEELGSGLPALVDDPYPD